VFDYALYYLYIFISIFFISIFLIKIKIKKTLQKITKQKKNLLTQALAYLFKDRIQKAKM